jgi:hypothetical protein
VFGPAYAETQEKLAKPLEGVERAPVFDLLYNFRVKRGLVAVGKRLQKDKE